MRAFGVHLRPGISAALLLALAATGCADESTEPTPRSELTGPLVVAAGDIACGAEDPAFNGGEGTETECRQRHTSELILDADHVFVLGDNQYWNGAIEAYQEVFDATWGKMKSVMRPTPGNHEYETPGADGYYEYFDVPEYYSFDIGSWHWVSLNSEIDRSSGSEQLTWLRKDLAETTKPCIGAFWHSPRFASGPHGSDQSVAPFWEELYEVGADVVLAGHSHNYERFGKQDPSDEAAADGIRQFVVGTGGRSLYGFPWTRSNSEVRASVFGVLALRLGTDGYEWEFRSDPPGEFTDSGSDICNE